MLVCAISWEQRELSDLIEENQKPVPKPDGEYIRLGIRSHAKGTFHEVVAEGEGRAYDAKQSAQLCGV